MDTWDDKTTGEKRSKLFVLAERVQFLDRREDAGPSPRRPRPATTRNSPPPHPAAPRATAPAGPAATTAAAAPPPQVARPRRR